MPILTKINGSPASMRRMGGRFRVLADVIRWDLGARVDGIRDESERDWQDDAGEIFRERMYNGGRSASRLDTSLESFGKALELLADVFELAQKKMTAARTTAIQGGLVPTETHIPDPPPPVIETDRGTIDNRLGGGYDRMIEAYANAEADARTAEEILYSGWATFQATTNQAKAEIAWRAGDFTAGVTRVFQVEVQSILKGHVEFLDETARATRRRISANTNPSLDEKLWSDYNRETAQAQKYRSRVARAIKGGRGIKISGWGLVFAGMGWDIYHGKPEERALFQTYLGLGSAHLAESLVIRLQSTRSGAWLGSRLGPWGAFAGGLIGGVGGAEASDFLHEKMERYVDVYTPELREVWTYPTRSDAEEA